MCGRYRRTTAEEEIARQYNIEIPAQPDLPISYNIAPSQNILTIREHPQTKKWSLDVLKWGLIPSWSKDEKIAYKTINARVETGTFLTGYGWIGEPGVDRAARAR
jgi:putative SOS response-associated peptidase YedK